MLFQSAVCPVGNLKASAAAPSRLRDLAQRAIAASAVLTAASIAGEAMADAEYARIDRAADAARRDLLDCLKHHGIDQAMAGKLGALL